MARAMSRVARPAGEALARTDDCWPLEVIQDLPEAPGAADAEASVLVLGPGISAADVKFRLGSLMIDLGQGDAIHFNGFDPDNPLSTAVLDAIEFADATRMNYAEVLARGFDLEGAEGDDVIIGIAFTDRIRSARAKGTRVMGEVR